VAKRPIAWYKYVELEMYRDKCVPQFSPWGKAKCDELYVLQWQEEHEHFGSWLGFIAIDNGVVHYAYLKKKYRGKGAGFLMYEFTMLMRGELKTYYSAASEDAKKVWNQLKNKYQYKKEKTHIIILPKLKK